MPLIIMSDEVDSRKEIQDAVAPFLNDFHLTGAQVLMGIYVRPERTKSGLYLSDQYREEDVYQGKAGLILKMGPMKFDEKDSDFFGENLPKVGDWVLYRPSDGFPMEFGNKQKCRILADRRQIKAILTAPDSVF